ncbi:MAG: class I SAM-dependent methyltransferase [Patescibacteria group bacterium]
MTEKTISGIDVWQNIEGDAIPGSTRVPSYEISDYFGGKTEGMVGLDLGSGSGRSTEVLKKALGCKVYALDLSTRGLKNTDTEVKVQAAGEAIPFPDNHFDFVYLCGVMTNIASRIPEISEINRRQVASEILRTLKPGGIVAVSDFSSDHSLTHYPVNYERHKLITNEYETIAVFEPKQKITFRGKTDDEIKALAGSPYLVRFAHHYSPEELTRIFESVGFENPEHSIELGGTPSGTPIENIIFVASKPSK